MWVHLRETVHLHGMVRYQFPGIVHVSARCSFNLHKKLNHLCLHFYLNEFKGQTAKWFFLFYLIWRLAKLLAKYIGALSFFPRTWSGVFRLLLAVPRTGWSEMNADCCSWVAWSKSEKWHHSDGKSRLKNQAQLENSAAKAFGCPEFGQGDIVSWHLLWTTLYEPYAHLYGTNIRVQVNSSHA